MQAMHVDRAFDRVHTEFIGGSHNLSPFHTSTRKPHGKAIRIVISTIPLFAHRRASELASPNHQGFVEKSALFEILQQRCDRLVGRSAVLGVILLNLGMSVSLAARAGIKFNKANTPFDKSSCLQAVPPECLRPFLIKSIGVLRRLCFLRKINGFRGVGLHLKRKLVRGNARFQFTVARSPRQMVPVDLIDVVQFSSLTGVADFRGRIQVQNGMRAR